MTAKTSQKGRLICLCGSVIELVEKRSEGQVETLLDALQAFKENRSFWVNFPPLLAKTINLGTGLRSAEEFIKTIQQAGGRVDVKVEYVLNEEAFTVSAQLTELRLVTMLVTDLGFPNGAKLKDIYAKAKSLGLALCPAEVGPQLRLQYMDQPSGEWLLVAMEPITNPAGISPGVFLVSCAVDHWLDIRPVVSTDFVWDGSDRWVFCLPPLQ